MGCLVPFLASYWHQALPHNQPRVLATSFPSVAVRRRPLLFLYEWVVGLGTIFTSVIPLAYK